MRHHVEHHLGVALAKKTIEAAWTHYQAHFARFHPKLEWLSDNEVRVTFTYQKTHFDGVVTIDDSKLNMEFHMPWYLRAFQPLAFSVIDHELAHWLKKAKAGEI